MYIELVLGDIEDFVHLRPQYRMIPALIFSSGPTGIRLALLLLYYWDSRFGIHKSYRDHLLYPSEDNFKVINHLPQSHRSWGGDLAVTMKLILELLLLNLWVWPGPLEICYRRSSPHRQWLRKHKCLKQVSHGSPRLSSTFSRGFAIVGDDKQGDPDITKWRRTEHTIILSCWRRVPSHHWKRDYRIERTHRGFLTLLKAVIYFLPRSDCTSEVAVLARRSLPKYALWFPRLMKRARTVMDDYVCRWEGQ